MRASTMVVGILAVAVIAGGAYWFTQHPMTNSGGGQDTALLATPPGITIQPGGGGGFGAPPRPARFTDAKSRSVYTFDKDVEPGKSTCVGDCAKAWPPVAAPANAQAYGDWSIVTREDGSKQWAYKGKPLYSYAEDTKITDVKGNNVDKVWHSATFQPTLGVTMPDGVSIQELANAGGHAFMNDQGMPLYTHDGDVKTPSDHWSPFIAAQIAKPVGDFTVIHGEDGVDQWAYKGKPLYSYDGDVVPGDAKGDGVDKWHVALLIRQFVPAGVALRHNRFGGDNFATADGMSLYVRDRVVGVKAGHNLRVGTEGNPTVGRLLGTWDCDADCTKTWRPLPAAADAQPSGYWEIATREDGTKQWVYRGFAVYTYAGDKQPGDMNGNDTYELMHGEDRYKVAEISIRGAGAMVWHTVVP